MKKIVTLLCVVCMVGSVIAAPHAQFKKSNVVPTAPRVMEQVQNAPTKEAMSIQAKAKMSKKVEVNKAVISQAKKAKAAGNAPTAFYYKPDGTLFCGIGDYLDDETGELLPAVRVFEVYHTLVGTCLNGYNTWTWNNYSRNATSIDYLTILDQDYPEDKGEGWSKDANDNFLDTTSAANFGQFGYYKSLRMPLQTATNEAGSDMFYLIGSPQTTRPDTIYSWTLAGVLNEFNGNGMWPLTNAIFSTPAYGNGRMLAWDTDEETGKFNYAFGTEPIDLIEKIDTIYVAGTGDIERLDTIYKTIQPATIAAIYEKPMSPLFIKNITLPIVALTYVAPTSSEEGGFYYDQPKFDGTLTLRIFDKDGNVVATSEATAADTVEMWSYYGSLVTFKLEVEDEYGGVVEGLVMDDEFMVAISGFDDENNSFGVWCAFDPYTGGDLAGIYDENGDFYQHAAANPFIMLNGAYYVLEHFLRTENSAQTWFDAEAQYIDTINIEVVEEDGEYIAIHADGDFKGYVPMLRATELLYDTISYAWNYVIDAPDWVSTLDMDSYNEPIWSGYSYTWWGYLHAYNLYIMGDATDDSVDGPAIGDEIILDGHGPKIVFKVVKVTYPEGIDDVKFRNDGKTYNVLGLEVGDDYKGVVIRNGEKFIR